MTGRAVCRECGHGEVEHSASGAVCYWNWAEYRRAPDGPWPCACPSFRIEEADPIPPLGEPPERLQLREPDRPDPAAR